MSEHDPYDLGEDFDLDSELSDQDFEKVRAAMAEIATLTPTQAEDVIIKLLQAVEAGDLPLSTLLGYSDDDLYNLYEQGYNLYKGGRPKHAAQVCEALLALNPGLPAALLLLAGCLMDLRQYPRALELVEEVLSVDDEDLEANLKRAHLLYRLGRLDESLVALERLLALDPDQASDEVQEGQRILEHVRELLRT